MGKNGLEKIFIVGIRPSSSTSRKNVSEAQTVYRLVIFGGEEVPGETIVDALEKYLRRKGQK